MSSIFTMSSAVTGTDSSAADERGSIDLFDFIQAPKPGPRGKRGSISAEAFGEWNQRKVFEPPVHPKTAEQAQELGEILKDAFLFSSLEAKDMQVVIDAMKGPISLEPDHKIIEEGDLGDVLYVVTDGRLDVLKSVDGSQAVVGSCLKGDLFGELALMYNCPRSASVVCGEAATVYELDRGTFNSIVMEAVQRKRKLCRSILESVPLFEGMPLSDLENIIDALKVEKHEADALIIRQGDVGEHFYIVYEGRLLATKVVEENSENNKTFVHSAGDFFGELALLNSTPRAATVVAETDCKLLSMDAATFERLNGPAKDFLVRGAARYE